MKQEGRCRNPDTWKADMSKMADIGVLAVLLKWLRSEIIQCSRWLP